ncbi:hypothetical protein [Heyndrickxia camelliae]|uniref:Uncharacterized protein n=1 Tax=Heyndrickxia camelliae TaxID=1707093 RepID=A0A2N3LLF0_9BACI|nr:hypothetical protein [Heyndrickxia camelliae]PKR85458.1 hypothetical protein CWO92_09765 [Heyndrickxia camelliae]
MNLSVKVSEMDFSIFIGQTVTEVVPISLELIRVKFNKGNLNVECSWRLRNAKGILVGISEGKESDVFKILESYLLAKEITNIYHLEPTEDLIIEFDKELYLDLFADSTSFEQYQLYGGDSLFLIGK